MDLYHRGLVGKYANFPHLNCRHHGYLLTNNKTVISGLIAFVALPNGVASAGFLSTEERDFAAERLASDNGGRFKYTTHVTI